MAQSGVLWMPRVQLIRGLARTMRTANLSASGRKTMPQVSRPAGRPSGAELIPSGHRGPIRLCAVPTAMIRSDDQSAPRTLAELLAFAGLWESFRWLDETVTRSFTILTTGTERGDGAIT